MSRIERDPVAEESFVLGDAAFRLARSEAEPQEPLRFEKDALTDAGITGAEFRRLADEERPILHDGDD